MKLMSKKLRSLSRWTFCLTTPPKSRRMRLGIHTQLFTYWPFQTPNESLEDFSVTKHWDDLYGGFPSPVNVSNVGVRSFNHWSRVYPHDLPVTTKPESEGRIDPCQQVYSTHRDLPERVNRTFLSEWLTRRETTFSTWLEEVENSTF